MSRLKRKNRKDISCVDSGGMLDLIDNTIKQYWRINDCEYNYICKNATDEELDLIVSENNTVSENKQAIMIVDKYINKYYSFD